MDSNSLLSPGGKTGDVASIELSRGKPDRKGADPSASCTFNDAERAKIGDKLCQHLERRDVSMKTESNGKRVYFLQGWKATEEANRIFGFDGWSQKILDCSVRFVEKLDSGRYSVCATAVVRITLKDGTTREGRGGGKSAGYLTKGDAIQTAEDDSIMVATQRALAGFGPRFGLCLRDPKVVKTFTDFDRPPKRPSNHEIEPQNGGGIKRVREMAESANRRVGSHRCRTGEKNGIPKYTGSMKNEVPARSVHGRPERIDVSPDKLVTYAEQQQKREGNPTVRIPLDLVKPPNPDKKVAVQDRETIIQEEFNSQALRELGKVWD